MLALGGFLWGSVAAQCGVRQGDPSPCFLHILAVDALFWSVQSVQGVGEVFAVVDDWEIEIRDAMSAKRVQSEGGLVSGGDKSSCKP